jgi:hypothetical protein
MHLLANISSHGLGHLAQAAPVLNALRQRLPQLRLTVRSAIPRARLEGRIDGAFSHIDEASDFGFVMNNALNIDLAASAQRYRDFHADWPQRVANEAATLAALQIDALLSDVAYLPLAGAAQAGIPAMALCSLNWADLFQHYFATEAWVPAIHADMLAAYRSAPFLITTPGMPMNDLPLRQQIGPIATQRNPDRHHVAQALGISPDQRWVLVALGGIEHRLPVENWPRILGVTWLVPAAWQAKRDDIVAFDATPIPFSDVLAAADAVVTKPGYGTFVEASCQGVPVLYLRRPDWPEEPFLLSWLHTHNRAAEISHHQAEVGDLAATLNQIWAQTAPPAPAPTGIADACDALVDLLSSRDSIATP